MSPRTAYSANLNVLPVIVIEGRAHVLITGITAFVAALVPAFEGVVAVSLGWRVPRIYTSR